MDNEEKKQGEKQKARANRLELLQQISKLAQALAQILSAIATVVKALFG